MPESQGKQDFRNHEYKSKELTRSTIQQEHCCQEQNEHNKNLNAFKLLRSRSADHNSVSNETYSSMLSSWDKLKVKVEEEEVLKLNCVLTLSGYICQQNWEQRLLVVHLQFVTWRAML